MFQTNTFENSFIVLCRLTIKLFPLAKSIKFLSLMSAIDASSWLINKDITLWLRPCITNFFSLRPYQNDYGNWRLWRHNYNHQFLDYNKPSTSGKTITIRGNGDYNGDYNKWKWQKWWVLIVIFANQPHLVCCRNSHFVLNICMS